MQLDHRQSAAILAFARTPARDASRAARSYQDIDNGRVANRALMLFVLALASLWLAFPPPQLSAGSPQGAPVESTGR